MNWIIRCLTFLIVITGYWVYSSAENVYVETLIDKKEDEDKSKNQNGMFYNPY